MPDTVWNLPTALLFFALLAVLYFIIRRLIRNKKQGRSSCGGGCAGCPMAGQCRRQK